MVEQNDLSPDAAACDGGIGVIEKCYQPDGGETEDQACADGVETAMDEEILEALFGKEHRELMGGAMQADECGERRCQTEKETDLPEG